MENSADPNWMKPSDQDLHSFPKRIYLFSAGQGFQPFFYFIYQFHFLCFKLDKFKCTCLIHHLYILIYSFKYSVLPKSFPDCMLNHCK